MLFDLGVSGCSISPEPDIPESAAMPHTTLPVTKNLRPGCAGRTLHDGNVAYIFFWSCEVYERKRQPLFVHAITLI